MPYLWLAQLRQFAKRGRDGDARRPLQEYSMDQQALLLRWRCLEDGSLIALQAGQSALLTSLEDALLPLILRYNAVDGDSTGAIR